MKYLHSLYFTSLFRLIFPVKLLQVDIDPVLLSGRHVWCHESPASPNAAWGRQVFKLLCASFAIPDNALPPPPPVKTFIFNPSHEFCNYLLYFDVKTFLLPVWASFARCSSNSFLVLISCLDVTCRVFLFSLFWSRQVLPPHYQRNCLGQGSYWSLSQAAVKPQVFVSVKHIFRKAGTYWWIDVSVHFKFFYCLFCLIYLWNFPGIRI